MPPTQPLMASVPGLIGRRQNFCLTMLKAGPAGPAFREHARARRAGQEAVPFYDLAITEGHSVPKSRGTEVTSE